MPASSTKTRCRPYCLTSPSTDEAGAQQPLERGHASSRQDEPVDEVVDGVLRLGLGYVNAYLVVTDDGLVLVDTGLPRTHAKLQQQFADARRSVGDIRTVLLTHWHTDHIGGLARVQRASGARIVASAIDTPVVSGAEPPPETTIMKLVKPLTGKPEHAPVDEALSADGPFSVPGFTAVHTPGHTAGHVSYLLDRAGGFLFAGDAAASGRGKVRYPPGWWPRTRTPSFGAWRSSRRWSSTSRSSATAHRSPAVRWSASGSSQPVSSRP